MIHKESIHMYLIARARVRRTASLKVCGSFDQGMPRFLSSRVCFVVVIGRLAPQQWLKAQYCSWWSDRDGSSKTGSSHPSEIPTSITREGKARSVSLRPAHRTCCWQSSIHVRSLVITSISSGLGTTWPAGWMIGHLSCRSEQALLEADLFLGSRSAVLFHTQLRVEKTQNVEWKLYGISLPLTV